MNYVEKDSIITDEYQNRYYVFNTVEYKNKEYAVCLEYDNPKNVVVLEYRFINNKLEIRKEEDEKETQILLIYSLNQQ